jgi:hypothetical protein
MAIPILELGDASALQLAREDSTVAAPKYKKLRLSISRIISLCGLNCEKRPNARGEPLLCYFKAKAKHCEEQPYQRPTDPALLTSLTAARETDHTLG